VSEKAQAVKPGLTELQGPTPKAGGAADILGGQTAALHTHHKERRITSMKFTKNIGMLLLAIWLILTGLAAFIPAIGGLGVVLAILAIAAGVFILLQR